MIEFDASELQALSADLSGAGSRIVSRARQVVAKTTADVTRDAKIMAPVDTGFLRNSITSSLSGTGDGYQGEVGPGAHYGGYVELGTSRNAPQPYLGPALDRNSPGFEQAMADLAQEVLGD